MTKTTDAPRVTDFELATHLFWVDRVLAEGDLADFLSPHAAASLARAVAREAHESVQKGTLSPTHAIRLKGALDRHPLAGVLTEEWRVRVAAAVAESYQQMWEGQWPE